MRTHFSNSSLYRSRWSGNNCLFATADMVIVTVNNAGGGANLPPDADAGPDQTVNEGASVTLNGAASDDSDGTIAATAYTWNQTGGPSVGALANTSGPSFTAPTVTSTIVLTFSLTVTDDDGADSNVADTVNVTVIGEDFSVSDGSGGSSFGQLFLPLMMLFSVFRLLRSRKTRF